MKFEVAKAISLTESYGTHECHTYREHIFKCHEFLSLALARHYARIASAKGYTKANLELGRLHNYLCLGKEFHGLFIDSPDEDVTRFSEQKSTEVLKLFSIKSRSLDNKHALLAVIEVLERCDLSFPLKDPRKANEAQILGALARCTNPLWWRRKIRKRQDFILEHVHIQLELVNLDKGRYVSNHCARRKHRQRKLNQELMASLVAENDIGEVFNLLEVAQRGMANLANRRNEMMTRVSGFEGIAKEKGDIAVFYTLTTPSKYHNYSAKSHKRINQDFNATPKEASEYLNTAWKRIRAKLDRLNIKLYGIRIAEPHHDGTPHWHMLLFMNKKHAFIVESVIRYYALQEDGNEKGAAKHRVTVEYINPNIGSATGYIAKYIAKNIDGEHVGTDEYGFDAIKSSVRVLHWASNWSIRQFQCIGGPSVTVWREARRLANSELADSIITKVGSELFEQLVHAADQGDWKTFVELSGGPNALRKDQPLRAFHVLKERPNSFGEHRKMLKGMIFQDLAPVVTRFYAWTIRPANKSNMNENFRSPFS